MPKSGGGQTISLTSTRYSRGERYVVNFDLLFYERNRSCIDSRPQRNHRASRRVRYFFSTIVSLVAIHWHRETNGLCCIRGRQRTPLISRRGIAGDGFTT